ncbi:MAG: DUF349 domain-containing protein [Xanthomonadales bacterium]|nr:DUF349 domain-containing protein [Xanthomonadales bacterium]
MSLLDSFRKPGWQSKDAGRRAQAVASETDPALLQALPGLAVDDPDPGVRRNALRRLDDPVLLARAMSADADTGLRKWAREAWLSAVVAGHCPLEEAALQTLQPAELEHLASRSTATATRSQALALCRRPAFLAERAVQDADAGLRLALVDRLDSAEALDRLADKARRGDKQVSRAARERAQRLRLSSGDPAAVLARAEAICADLDAWLRGGSPVSERESALALAERDWAALASDALPDRLAIRFRGLCQTLRAQLAPPPADVEPEPVATSSAQAGQAEDGADVASAPPPSPEELAAQVRLQAELAALAQARELERQRLQEREAERAVQRARQAQHLEALAEALAAGDLGRAREAEAQLDSNLFDASLRRQRQALDPELRKLRDWEHWANNKVRARLCDDLETLAGSGLHPDALATRVREVQTEWKRLDALEGRAEGAEPSGLDRRFRAICARVLKPARGFFEKRDALRKEREQAIEDFLTEANDRIASADIAELLRLQSEASARLRSLADLPAALRQRIARRLTGLLDTLRPGVEAAFAESEQARARLVDAARRLVGAGADVNRGAESRRLMQSWKALGKGRPGRDQKQWREFRAALDEAFAELESARSREQSQREGLRQQALAVVEEAEALAADDVDPSARTASRLRDLQGQWQSLDCRDGDLGRRMEQAVAAVRLAIQDVERARRQQRLLDSLQALPVSGSGGDADAALGVVFEIESLAGIEPPPADREARRHWQLERLQRHLRGERNDGDGDLESLLQRWLSLVAGVEARDREPMAERLRAAIAAIG